MFTTNHLPAFLEQGERRYYVLDASHDASASDPRANMFSALVGEVVKAMADPTQIARLYNALKARELSEGFNAQTLNTDIHGTALMKRLQGPAVQTNHDQLQEFLEQKDRGGSANLNSRDKWIFRATAA